MQTSESLIFLIDTLTEHSQDDRKNTLLIGNPDSKIIENFVNRSIQGDRNELNEIIKLEKPYLFINDSCFYRSTRELYKSILNQFLIAYDYTANLNMLEKEVCYRIKKYNVKVLIINGFYKLFKYEKSDLKTIRILFALNQLVNELCLSMVAIGNQEAGQYLNSKTQYKYDIVELSSF